jgi:hypothetical protein
MMRRTAETSTAEYGELDQPEAEPADDDLALA